MDRMFAIGVEVGLVRELHDSAQFVPLGTGREVDACQGFEEAWDLALECTNFGKDAIFLVLRDAGLPAKGKGVNDHGVSVPNLALA